MVEKAVQKVHAGFLSAILENVIWRLCICFSVVHVLNLGFFYASTLGVCELRNVSDPKSRVSGSGDNTTNGVSHDNR